MEKGGATGTARGPRWIVDTVSNLDMGGVSWRRVVAKTVIGTHLSSAISSGKTQVANNLKKPQCQHGSLCADPRCI